MAEKKQAHAGAVKEPQPQKPAERKGKRKLSERGTCISMKTRCRLRLQYIYNYPTHI